MGNLYLLQNQRNGLKDLTPRLRGQCVLIVPISGNSNSFISICHKTPRFCNSAKVSQNSMRWPKPPLAALEKRRLLRQRSADALPPYQLRTSGKGSCSSQDET